MKTSSLVRLCLPFISESHTRHKLDKRSDEVRLRLSHRGAHIPQTYTSVSQQLVMWTNATIWTTDLEIMSFLVFAVGIVNTGWPRPLARSRTSGNHGVLVLENVSFEPSFSKIRDLCQRAIRCTSTWRSCIRIFQSTRTRDCKFLNRALQKIILHFANSDFCICKIRKLTFATTWSHPFQSLKTIGCNFWCRVFAKSQKKQWRTML